MHVKLKPELEKFVTERVDAGQYVDADDMVNEALALLKEQAELSRQEEDELRADLLPAIQQLDRGESKPFDAEAIIARERARLAQREQP